MYLEDRHAHRNRARRPPSHRVLAQAGRPPARRGLRPAAGRVRPDPPPLAGPDRLQAGPATVQELDASLAPFLDDQEPTTRPVLDDLAARDWATWTEGGQAATTPDGRAAHDELLAEVAAQRRRVADGVSPEEYRATVAVLQRMAANLGWSDPGDAPGR